MVFINKEIIIDRTSRASCTIFLRRYAFPNPALGDQPIPKSAASGYRWYRYRRAQVVPTAEARTRASVYRHGTDIRTRCWRELASAGARARIKRYRGLMGAWCGASSRPDLRRRPCHRCAVATSLVSQQTGERRRRRRRPPEAADESMIATGNCPPVAHRLSRLGRNKLSDAASRSVEELSGRRDDGVAVAPWGSRRASWRQSSGVATPQQENTSDRNGRTSPTARSLTFTTRDHDFVPRRLDVVDDSVTGYACTDENLIINDV